MHIVFVTSVASKNVNEKIKTQTSSPPFVGGYMVQRLPLKEGGGCFGGMAGGAWAPPIFWKKTAVTVTS